MENWNNKTNNEISIRLIEIEYEHTTIKDQILALHDKMIELENDFIKGKGELDRRLKINFNNE